VYITFTLSHPTASTVYSAKSLGICIWPNMAVSASLPPHKHGQKWPLRRLKVNMVVANGGAVSDVSSIVNVTIFSFASSTLPESGALQRKNLCSCSWMATVATEY
jgi:hypothetical protein